MTTHVFTPPFPIAYANRAANRQRTVDHSLLRYVADLYMAQKCICTACEAVLSKGTKAGHNVISVTLAGSDDFEIYSYPAAKNASSGSYRNIPGPIR